MTEWTGGHMPECPAIAELKAALLATGTILTADKLGTTRPDGSRHDAGLAMDIMLDSRRIDEKPLADQIIAAVVKLHSRMRWSDILYTDWNATTPVFFHIPGAPPFGGPNGMLKKNPNHNLKLGMDHINHVHIDWWTGSATTLLPSSRATGFKDSLVQELQKPPQWLVDYVNSLP